MTSLGVGLAFGALVALGAWVGHAIESWALRGEAEDWEGKGE